MEITITYMTINDQKECSFKVEPDEYFDPLESNENYWEHGIERYPLRYDYLPASVGLLKWFIITEKLDSKQRVTRYQLLNGDSSIMIHSRDEFGNEEIISSALVEPETWHTTRMIKPYDGVWATYVDSLDSDAQIDGKYPSKNLISNWRFEELKEFSYVHSAL